MSNSNSTAVASPRLVAKPCAVTADDLVDRIRELRPWLREMQPEAERQRRVPQESVERLDAIGVYSLTTPPRFGGADFSARDLFRLYEALGLGCGATAWTVWAATGGNLWSAAFDDSVIRPVYEEPWVGNRTCAVGGSTRRLAGTARKVDGGWMIKGSWFFATASGHGSHAYLAVYLDETDDSKVGMVLVPRDQFVLLDDWDAIGLAGTGSATIVIRDELFVPDERFSSPQILLARYGRARPRALSAEHRQKAYRVFALCAAAGRRRDAPQRGLCDHEHPVRALRRRSNARRT